jgi:UDP-galactopyranose mutase
MTMNEYLNQFIQLSRYTTNDVSTDEKKQDTFLKGLNDKIQFWLLNTDYPDFQHLVDKAIIIENKLKEMENYGKCKMVFLGQHIRSNARPRLSQPNQFTRTLYPSRAPMQVPCPQF